MSRKDLLRLILLAAIWGSSFLFMRILAPAIGAMMTVELRLLLTGVALLAVFGALRFNFEWKRFWKQYTITGAINSALPFCLYGYAALHLPASYLAIFNSSTPLFGVLFSALWLNDKLTVQKLLGVALGAIGVALVAKTGAGGKDDGHFIMAALACLGGSACYAIAGVYMKLFAQGAKPVGMATGSQIASAILLLPAFMHLPPVAAFTPLVIGSILTLSLLCSGVAYLLYFSLLANTGPAKASTVTFLVPAFAMVWGSLFLHEQITGPMLGGCALIIAGTTCVLGLLNKKNPVTSA